MAMLGSSAFLEVGTKSNPLQLLQLNTTGKCRPLKSHVLRAAVAEQATPSSASEAQSSDPLMIRALRGEKVERPPVWMMRQAGRYMKVYQDLCKKHKTFRERSENVDLAVEISLQPWEAFKPDGVILFSDILTPLAGMNIDFDIVQGKGPIIADPIRSMEQVKQVTALDPDATMPFVGEALKTLRQEVGNASTVLGFVGAPFTLASYIVEGGSSKTYSQIKKMAFSAPDVLHALNTKLAESVIDYVRYQADSGAQAVQIFDSWASHLSPQDFDVFAGPYIKQIIDAVKQSHPDLPIILYISGSGGLLERMTKCGPDIISIDGSVDLSHAITRCGKDFAYQGNMDPGVLFGDHATIEQRVKDTIEQGRDVRHIMNLGHGIMLGTPEDSVEKFFDTALNYKY